MEYLENVGKEVRGGGIEAYVRDSLSGCSENDIQRVLEFIYQKVNSGAKLKSVRLSKTPVRHEVVISYRAPRTRESSGCITENRTTTLNLYNRLSKLEFPCDRLTPNPAWRYPPNIKFGGFYWLFLIDKYIFSVWVLKFKTIEMKGVSKWLLISQLMPKENPVA